MFFGLFTTAGEKRRAIEREERTFAHRAKMARQTLRDAGICPKHRRNMDDAIKGTGYVCPLCKEEKEKREAEEATEALAYRARKISEAKKTLGWDDDSTEVTQLTA